AAVIAGGLDISPKVIRFDMPIMLAVALVCIPVFWTRGVITRMEGGLFVLYYGLYTTYIVLSATHHPTLPGYRRILLFVVMPLTLIALVIGIVGSVRARRDGNGGSAG
ncbi:MAG: sodium:calcium antiporter, partial [Gemmatimonadetes bacterium]|nr:sodium:calcium antiporter [Gemmatimonadota bacterium]